MLNSEGRYERRSREARNRFIRFLTIALILCFASYKFGYEAMRSRAIAYKTEMSRLHEDRGRLEQVVTSLRSELKLSQMRYKKLEDTYNEQIPKGNFKKLSQMIEKQLNSGISFDRLSSIIASTQPPKNCSEPSTRRFVMRTPMYNGPHGEVSFANGAIVISGDGKSAINGEGKEESWFDPGKEVSITFTLTGGKKLEKRGLLPIYNSIVIDNKEYRFNIAAGERSFINVTADSCDFS